MGFESVASGTSSPAGVEEKPMGGLEGTEKPLDPGRDTLANFFAFFAELSVRLLAEARDTFFMLEGAEVWSSA